MGVDAIRLPTREAGRADQAPFERGLSSEMRKNFNCWALGRINAADLKVWLDENAGTFFSRDQLLEAYSKAVSKNMGFYSKNIGKMSVLLRLCDAVAMLMCILISFRMMFINCFGV